MLHVSDSSCLVALQAKFVENQQALLHGDLHTGSLMVTEDTTYVIDAEFAFYGPIAFDVGKMVANLLIAYFASFGLETADSPRIEQRRWLMQVGTAFWHDLKLSLVKLMVVLGLLYGGCLLLVPQCAGCNAPAIVLHQSLSAKDGRTFLRSTGCMDPEQYAFICEMMVHFVRCSGQSLVVVVAGSHRDVGSLP